MQFNGINHAIVCMTNRRPHFSNSGSRSSNPTIHLQTPPFPYPKKALTFAQCSGIKSVNYIYFVKELMCMNGIEYGESKSDTRFKKKLAPDFAL